MDSIATKSIKQWRSLFMTCIVSRDNVDCMACIAGIAMLEAP